MQLEVAGNLACLSKLETLRSNPFASKRSDVGSGVSQRVKQKKPFFSQAQCGSGSAASEISPSWRE